MYYSRLFQFICKRVHPRGHTQFLRMTKIEEAHYPYVPSCHESSSCASYIMPHGCIVSVCTFSPSIAKPRLFHLHLARGTPLGHLFESKLGGTTRRTFVIVRQGSPCLGAFGKDISAVLYVTRVRSSVMYAYHTYIAIV